jgi:hypothetical protein
VEDVSHPFFLSCEIIFRRHRYCVREGGCESDIAIKDSGAGDESDDELVLAEDGSVRQMRRCRITCITEGNTLLGHLEELLGEKQLNRCDRQLFDPNREGAEQSTSGGFRYCSGPNILAEAKVVKWPHTMVFDVNGATGRGYTLQDIPFTFQYKTKKFVLRSILIGGGGHFTALIRCPEAWMFYDGIDNVHRFRMYQLNQPSYEFMERKSLNFILYEIVDDTIQEDFGNVCLERIYTDQTPVVMTAPDDNDDNSEAEKDRSDSDESSFFDAAPFLADDYNNRNINAGGSTESQKEIIDGLKEARKDAQELLKKHKVKETKNKKKKEKTTTTKPTKSSSDGTTRKERIVRGFSVRRQGQKRGPRPICKGCGMQIEYTDMCIRHNYKERNHHKHATVDQYHGRASCLKKMTRAKLAEFKTKKWTDGNVIALLNEMNS